jgi:7-cyano-7-deazaguanine synthase
MALSGFGRRVPSGITSRKLRIREDAFLPGRNLLLLLVGAAYAVSKRADAVCIGLLNDANRLFPDQTTDFLGQAEGVIRVATMSDVRVVAPLAEFDKKSVITLAARRGITGTYSCHSGRARRCGKCVSCLERIQAEEER